MGNLDVKVLSWDAAKSKIEEVNRPLFLLLEPIASYLKQCGQDYVYMMGFNYGEPIIEDGQMIALKKDGNKNYVHATELKFDLTNIGSNGAPDLTQFEKDCGQDTDHPLALVTKNYIEIYCTHNSAIKLNEEKKKYSFPLNVIEKGELFGVWGSVNSISDDPKENYYGYSGVAGKACILPLFPEPLENRSSRWYRNCFSDIFPDSEAKPLNGILNAAKQLCGSDAFAEIIIIPEAYYLFRSDESQEFQNAKSQLREFLFKTAWKQTKFVREATWADKELMSILNLAESDFSFHLIKHIISISKGESFLLKPVSESDGVLFAVFQRLVSQFKERVDRSGKNLLDYTTPIFLHYAKLSKQNPSGIELTHSPSINMVFPDTRLDVMKDQIVSRIFTNNKVQKYLASKGIDVTLEYFKEMPAKADPTKHITDLNEYVKGHLNKIYSPYLDDAEVRLPKAPTLFNSFIHIERANWH